MPLVPAKCTQCGAALTLDPSQDAAVCPFCGTPFVVEKAINNYNVTNQTTIGTVEHVEHLHVNDEHSVEARLKGAEASLTKLHDYEQAFRAFKAIADEKADEWRAWWGMARAKTCDFRDASINPQKLKEASDCWDKAMALAPDGMRSELQETIGSFYSLREQGRIEEYKLALSGMDPDEVDRVDKQSAREMAERFEKLTGEAKFLQDQIRDWTSTHGGCLRPILYIVAVIVGLSGVRSLGMRGPSGGGIAACAVAVGLAVAAIVWRVIDVGKKRNAEQRRDAAQRELERLRHELDIKQELVRLHSQWDDDPYSRAQRYQDESVMRNWTGSYFMSDD